MGSSANFGQTASVLSSPLHHPAQSAHTVPTPAFILVLEHTHFVLASGPLHLLPLSPVHPATPHLYMAGSFPTCSHNPHVICSERLSLTAQSEASFMQTQVKNKTKQNKTKGEFFSPSKKVRAGAGRAPSRGLADTEAGRVDVINPGIQGPLTS